MKKVLDFIDKLHIWAVLHFAEQLPDLQQTQKPTTGKIYYYYGRWFRLRRREKNTTEWAKYVLKSSGQGHTGHYEKMNDMLHTKLCTNCHIHQLGLPCVKRNGGTSDDLCFRYRYELVKGKASDQITPNS